MAEMKFRLKKDAGFHKDKATGKTYRAGDVVPSKKDLIKEFRGKFEEVHETKPGPEGPVLHNTGPEKQDTTKDPYDHESGLRIDQTDAQPRGDKADAKAAGAEKKSQEEGDDFGDEVTDDFADAKKAEVKVYHKDGEYQVVDTDTNKPVNKAKLMTKPATAQFIKKHLKEI